MLKSWPMYIYQTIKISYFFQRGVENAPTQEHYFCIVMKGKVSKRKFKIYMNSLQNIRTAGIEKKREKGKNFYSISSTLFQPIQSSYNTKVYSETQTAFLSSFERNINLNITILVKSFSYKCYSLYSTFQLLNSTNSYVRQIRL